MPSNKVNLRGYINNKINSIQTSSVPCTVLRWNLASQVLDQKTRISLPFHMNNRRKRLFARRMPPKAPAITAAYPVSRTQVSSENPMPKVIAFLPTCIAMRNSDMFAVYESMQYASVKVKKKRAPQSVIATPAKYPTQWSLFCAVIPYTTRPAGAMIIAGSITPRRISASRMPLFLTVRRAAR